MRKLQVKSVEMAEEEYIELALIYTLVLLGDSLKMSCLSSNANSLSQALNATIVVPNNRVFP